MRVNRLSYAMAQVPPPVNTTACRFILSLVLREIQASIFGAARMYSKWTKELHYTVYGVILDLCTCQSAWVLQEFKRQYDVVFQTLMECVDILRTSTHPLVSHYGRRGSVALSPIYPAFVPPSFLFFFLSDSLGSDLVGLLIDYYSFCKVSQTEQHCRRSLLSLPTSVQLQTFCETLIRDQTQGSTLCLPTISRHPPDYL